MNEPVASDIFHGRRWNGGRTGKWSQAAPVEIPENSNARFVRGLIGRIYCPIDPPADKISPGFCS
jgi:hypothetical protein